MRVRKLNNNDNLKYVAIKAEKGNIKKASTLFIIANKEYEK